MPPRSGPLGPGHGGFDVFKGSARQAWLSATTTRSSTLPGRQPRLKSRRLSPAGDENSIRIATPAIMSRRNGSRSARKPPRCSVMRDKRAIYDPARSCRTGGRRPARRRPARCGCLQRYLRRCVRRHLRRRPPRWRRPLAGLPWRGPALRDRAGTRAGGVRLHHGTGTAEARGMWHLPWHRCGQGQPACHLRHLRRQRPGARVAGFLPVAADLPALPRHGHDRAQPLRHLPGQGACDARRAVGEGSGGGRYRRSHPFDRRGRGRPQRRTCRDLYVEVRVREHAIFAREGEHLSCEVPISFATAALGGTLEVPTLDGDVTIKIPPESQSGRVFRCATRA